MAQLQTYITTGQGDIPEVPNDRCLEKLLTRGFDVSQEKGNQMFRTLGSITLVSLVVLGDTGPRERRGIPVSGQPGAQ